MNKNKIDKSAHIFEQIVKINNRIKEISEMAILAADRPIETLFELKMNDLMKKKKEICPSIDVDFQPFFMNKIDIGNMIRDVAEKRLAKNMGFGIFPDSSLVDEYDHVIKYEPSNETLLRILALLLQEAKNERSYYLKNLSEMGIKI